MLFKDLPSNTFMVNGVELQLALSPDTFKIYVSYIRELTGIHIGPNRINMVQGRFRRRINELNQQSFEHYLDFVKDNAQEKLIFIDLITTNETQFFRTPRVWNYISEVFLPQWYNQNPNRVFRAWSAAASSGEEAHSLGIVCQQFKEQNSAFNYQILGTDISPEMVKLCQQGDYGGKSLQAFKNIKSDCFTKYMRGAPNEKYQIIPEIKSRLRFQQHNLFKPFIAKDGFDLILIRNVLIYFTLGDQEKVLELIAAHLDAQGLLIIGESESLTHIKTAFRYLEPLVYCKNTKEKAA